MIRPFRAGLGAVVLTVILAGCARESGDRTGADPAPAGGVELVRGGFDKVEAALDAAKGKVVLIDCWATWCGPCVATFPLLVEKHRKYADRGLAVITLSLDDPDDAGQAVAFLREQKATFTNLHLATVDAAARKGMTDRFAFRGGIPHAVLFDRAGARVWAGHPMDPSLESQIQSELAK
jgi:thiol-disulfide isomerase/thioredoxin